MQALSTFAGTRRARRRRRLRRYLAVALVVASFATTAALAYQVGVAQERAEAERRDRDITNLRERNRALQARAARADQQAEAAIARAARAEQDFRARLPQGELLLLTELAALRLRAGIAPDRLAAVLREVGPDRRCAAELEVHRLAVHPPRSAPPVPVAAFAAGRIMASAEVEEGEPAAPLTVRFLMIDGEVTTASGGLPLAHRIVLGAEEFRFAVRASGRPGELQLTAQRCSWP